MSVPQFSTTGYLKVPDRSSFNLSHDNFLSCNMGKLVPVYWTELVPNDSFKVQQSALIRFQPLLAPIMSQIDVKFYWFKVPNRLIYSEWEKFITPKVTDNIEVGTQVDVTSEFVPPYTTLTRIMKFLDDHPSSGDKYLRLLDYLGVPVYNGYDDATDNDTHISLLSLLTYHRIWYDYFRDENLDDDTPYPTHGGMYDDDDELMRLFTLHDKAWDKDYFTSALPFAQKGPKVTIPIGQNASLTSKDVTNTLDTYSGETPAAAAKLDNFISTFASVYGDGGNAPKIQVVYDGTTVDAEVKYNADTSSNEIVFRDPNNGNFIGFTAGTIPNNTQVKVLKPKLDASVDLTTATATTIDQFRTLSKLQSFFERAALVGTRYVELLKGFFGVTPSDARLQRAEYIGGSKLPVIVNDVFANAETQTTQGGETTTTPLGSYAGKANAFGTDESLNLYSEEHGIVMCLMCIVPKTGYYQGIGRKFICRGDYTKYFWPQFSHLGEQEVLNAELYATSDKTKNQGTFGYQSRYVEYKFEHDEIHGDFCGNLDFWHMSRRFTSLPALNAEFIHMDPTKRIFAVTDTDVDSILCDVHFDITAIRPMPEFSYTDLL